MTTHEQKLIEAISQAGGLHWLGEGGCAQEPTGAVLYFASEKDCLAFIALASIPPDPMETQPKPLPEEIEAVLKSLRLWEGGMWSGHDVARRARLLIETFIETPPVTTPSTEDDGRLKSPFGGASATDADATILHFGESKVVQDDVGRFLDEEAAKGRAQASVGFIPSTPSPPKPEDECPECHKYFGHCPVCHRDRPSQPKPEEDEPDEILAEAKHHRRRLEEEGYWGSAENIGALIDRLEALQRELIIEREYHAVTRSLHRDTRDELARYQAHRKSDQRHIADLYSERIKARAELASARDRADRGLQAVNTAQISHGETLKELEQTKAELAKWKSLCDQEHENNALLERDLASVRKSADAFRTKLALRIFSLERALAKPAEKEKARLGSGDKGRMTTEPDVEEKIASELAVKICSRIYKETRRGASKTIDWDHAADIVDEETALLSRQVEELRKRKDDAYLERNRLVALLAHFFPSGIARTAIEGWSNDWHGCVYIDLPTGQVSWHYHDSHAFLFADLSPYCGSWDGHNTEEKYRRCAALSSTKPETEKQ